MRISICPSVSFVDRQATIDDSCTLQITSCSVDGTEPHILPGNKNPVSLLWAETLLSPQQRYADLVGNNIRRTHSFVSQKGRSPGICLVTA